MTTTVRISVSGVRPPYRVVAEISCDPPKRKGDIHPHISGRVIVNDDVLADFHLHSTEAKKMQIEGLGFYDIFFPNLGTFDFTGTLSSSEAV